MPHLLLKDLPRYECLLEAAKELPGLDPSATEAFLHLLRTSDEAAGVTEKNLANHNISQGRFCVLMLLWRSYHPRAAKLLGAADCCGPRTPAELADAAGVTRATMTGLVDTLERDGYVTREPDPADRRMMSVRLTAKGDKFLQDFLPGHFKVTASVMSSLSEVERRTLVGLLVKVQQNVAALKVAREEPADATASI
ncbi:MAG TPA: MarR family transcriptional regulator [Lacunisphaera sp.]|nr:MarR family transcriptional regulator [Lacunisphaera sp.]